jgi:predicted N-acyltransferase
MGNSVFDVQIAQTVTDIGQERWDCLGQEQPFASYRWANFGETVLQGDRPIYIVVSRQGQPIARATFWLSSQEPLPIPVNVVRSSMRAVLRRWPLMVCRAPVASASGLVLPTDPILREEALKAITETAQDVARQHNTSFLIFDYLETAETDMAGFTPYNVPESGTRLVLNWPDFESYTKQLSKSAKKDYHRHCNRAADLGIEVRLHNRVTEIEQAIALLQNVERQHNSSPNPHLRRVLENAHLVNSLWMTATFDKRLVGCGLLLGDEDIQTMALLGLDYNVQYVYFQLVYAAIRGAIESGARALRGGTAAYEIKQRLGFDLERNNNIAFMTHNRLLQQVARRLVAAS